MRLQGRAWGPGRGTDPSICGDSCLTRPPWTQSNVTSTRSLPFPPLFPIARCFPVCANVLITPACWERRNKSTNIRYSMKLLSLKAKELFIYFTFCDCTWEGLILKGVDCMCRNTMRKFTSVHDNLRNRLGLERWISS